MPVDEGAPVPRDARRFAGLAFMGGPMSVNDPLQWLPPLFELIRDSVAKDVPVIGHCLGGQLISKAFGGEVGAAALKEIGWGEVEVCDNAVASDWFGELPRFEGFHWHGEAFSIPAGATRVLTGVHCKNQAFALGKHFGMQCHVEMTGDLIRAWCRGGAAEIEASSASPAVQTPQQMNVDLARRVAALHAVADRIYDRWCEGLAKDA